MGTMTADGDLMGDGEAGPPGNPPIADPMVDEQEAELRNSLLTAAYGAKLPAAPQSRL